MTVRTFSPKAADVQRQWHVIDASDVVLGRLASHAATLLRIASRFNQKEDMYWATDLRILNFEKVRETSFRPWAAQTIPRRFCSGIVEISDGSRHVIHYSIAEDAGMIGASCGVEWCIVGLDRNWAYNPACKMARP